MRNFTTLFVDIFFLHHVALHFLLIAVAEQNITRTIKNIKKHSAECVLKYISRKSDQGVECKSFFSTQKMNHKLLKDGEKLKPSLSALHIFTTHS